MPRSKAGPHFWGTYPKKACLLFVWPRQSVVGVACYAISGGFMLYLYLDESGDLGFDFISKRPSSFFTVCILAVKGQENDRALAKAVKTVAKRRLRAKASKDVPELKGSLADLTTKKHFFKALRSIPFRLHSTTLNKRLAYGYLAEDKERIYNYIARLTLDQIDFKEAAVRVIMTVDKSKGKTEVRNFNHYILAHIKARLEPKIPLEIYHADSRQNPGLQAADMFAWGLFRKYEVRDYGWYEVFKDKITGEKLFQPEKERRARQAG